MEFDRKALKRWLEEALVTNTTFHNLRKGLLESLVRCKGRGMTISVREWFVLKQYLSMRSEKLQKEDDASLAFQELIGRLIERCEEGDAESESGEEQKADNAPGGNGGKDPKSKLTEH